MSFDKAADGSVISEGAWVQLRDGRRGQVQRVVHESNVGAKAVRLLMDDPDDPFACVPIADVLRVVRRAAG